MKNTSWLAAAAFLLLISLAAVSAAESRYIYVSYNPRTERLNVSVFEENQFYEQDLFRGIHLENSSYRVRLLGQGNRTVTEFDYFAGENNYAVFSSDISRIVLMRGRSVSVSRELSFCNSNGICEPCEGDRCSLIESSATCPDCRSGSRDFYCDLERDGICDPDCAGFDGDCKDCSAAGCLYADMLEKHTSCLKDYYGEICRAGQACTGRFAYTDDAGSMCCVEGKCFDKAVPPEPDKSGIQTGDSVSPGNTTEAPAAGNPEPKGTGGGSAIVIIIAILAILLIAALAALYYLRKKNIIVISIISVLLLVSVVLVLPGGGREEGRPAQITGFVTREEAVTSLPEIFKPEYSADQKNNLMTALESISYEFKQKGTDVTPELVASIVTTLRKEVGGSFRPVEEYGDYCKGPGCTFKVLGLCRSTPYGGGCDYKGRGYIQITHDTNYRTYGGDDFLSPAPDTCNCEGVAYCRNQDCNPSKAMRPGDAARIFVGYYNGRGLVSLSAQKDFWHVGKYINGGDSYADSFSGMAQDTLTALNAKPAETQSFLQYLNSVVPDQDPDLGGSESEGLPEEVLTGKKDGFYYLNPSFRAEASFSLAKYSQTIAQAKALVTAVEGCTGRFSACVDDNMPAGWTSDCDERDKTCKFIVDTGAKNHVYDADTGVYSLSPVLIKFALVFPNYQPDEGAVCLQLPLRIQVFGDSITDGARACSRLRQKFDLLPDFSGQIDINYSGLTSETAQGSLARIDKAVDEYGPDIVLLWHGMNQGAGPDAYKDAYGQIIDNLLARGITPIIVSPIYLCRDSRRSWDPYFDELSGKMGELKAEHPGRVFIIDLRAVMKGEFEDGKSCGDWFTGGEDIHPTCRGQDFIATDIAQAFSDWKESSLGPFTCP